jgi:TPR repeat protein
MICAMACAAGAQDRKAESFAWDGPEIAKSVFTHDLGLLDSERDEYATTLATLAGNGIAAAKASPASLAAGRKMLALALQLSPRNKRSVVVNFQLSKGVLPEPAESAYSPDAFARLLLTRGQLLQKQGGEENLRLARYFIQLAAELDPRNEDAVYASEVQRLDSGAPDWKALTDPQKP